MNCVECGTSPGPRGLRRKRCAPCYRAHLRDLKESGTFSPAPKGSAPKPKPASAPKHVAITLTESQAAGFWSRVSVADAASCWPWTGVRLNGYGRFSVKTLGGLLAHRIAYTLVHGAIPEGLELDHLCRNPACVNPAHLEPVTARENSLRSTGFAAQNVAKTRCPQGHPYDEANTCLVQGRERRCRTCNRERQRARRAAARGL